MAKTKKTKQVEKVKKLMTVTFYEHETFDQLWYGVEVNSMPQIKIREFQQHLPTIMKLLAKSIEDMR
jgi:hypothetical protein